MRRIVEPKKCRKMTLLIFFPPDVAVEKLCDIDPDWDRSCTVKRGIRSMLHLYYEILQE